MKENDVISNVLENFYVALDEFCIKTDFEKYIILSLRLDCIGCSESTLNYHFKSLRTALDDIEQRFSHVSNYVRKIHSQAYAEPLPTSFEIISTLKIRILDPLANKVWENR